MTETERRYRAFLLRLWQERGNDKWIWRASLEDPHTNVRKGFADLEHLCAFLKEQTEDQSNDDS